MIIIVSKRGKLYISLVIITLLIFLSSSVLYLTKDEAVFTSTQAKNTIQNGIPVPIIMYHSILKSSPELGKYVITPTEFESDLKYLKEHGYSTINMTDLINYVHNNGKLPPKPVMITFDDGNLNNYIYGKPLLEKYKMKAVISVVGKYCDKFTSIAQTSSSQNNNPDYAYTTWAQVKEMSDSGYFEIQNHTYNLHLINKRNGAKRIKGESLEAYKKVLVSDIGKLQDRLTEVTGIRPNTFTYPFGSISKESKEILKELGFKATLGCAQGVNYIDKNKEDVLFRLKRNNRPHGVSSKNFFKKLCQ